MKLPADIDWSQLAEIVDIDGHLVADAAWLTQDLALAMYVDMAGLAPTPLRRDMRQSRLEVPTPSVPRTSSIRAIASTACSCREEFRLRRCCRTGAVFPTIYGIRPP